MNKDLELEAEKANGYAHYGKPLGEKYLAFNEGFIAGATSKWIEKQKLEFAIEQLNKLEFDPKENILDFVLHIKNKIKELEKKLKQL